MPGKTHYTAVVAIPPTSVWGPIQAIRRRHDRQIARWMPHVNLLYPFRPPEWLEAAETDLLDACAEAPPFRVRLAEFRFFTHPSGRSTVWLAPEPREAFVRLYLILRARFRDCDDADRLPGGYVPHLSVGQVDDRNDLMKLREAWEAHWQALEFDLDTLAVIRRDERGPFRVVREFTLRGQAPGHPEAIQPVQTAHIHS